ncbi:MAG: recombinase family protein [Acidobacteriaceae bacterium]
MDPDDSPAVIRMMEQYATGGHTISTLQKMLKAEFGKTMSRQNVNKVLRSRFYIGEFKWGSETYRGNHDLFVPIRLFDQVQAVLDGHNRPKYAKRNLAFRELRNCAYDGCTVTGELKKEKYVYYRCTGYRGKCDLPRFRKEDLAARLGEPLKGLQVPSEIVTQIVETLERDQQQSSDKMNAERSRLEARISMIRKREWIPPIRISSTEKSPRVFGAGKWMSGEQKSNKKRCSSIALTMPRAAIEHWTPRGF